ncbi:hypothetical protein SAMN02983003_1644 [Devosia enhydra]|uniref:Uncharacterized protein n=1 Tax=Devosia enhydra TaxID=665118 RepID=A0A1K2HWN5_9HYPH|nr:hypothetical protein [Devosia enhydra]SFZ83440.1 hypothetical protein SAMN02983003_1644 [Devosia enhydra]
MLRRALGRLAIFIAALLALMVEPRAEDRAAAEERFWRAVAAAHTVDAGIVALEPVPQDIAETLAIGTLVPLRAIIGGSEAVVQGYGDVAGGNPAFPRFRSVGSDGIASLLRALAILDPNRTLSAQDIIPRIAWAYPEFGVPVAVPGMPWTITNTTTGATLEWTTRNSSRSGILNFWRIALHVDEDHRADLRRVDIPNPFLLKGTVSRFW